MTATTILFVAVQAAILEKEEAQLINKNERVKRRGLGDENLFNDRVALAKKSNYAVRGARSAIKDFNSYNKAKEEYVKKRKRNSRGKSNILIIKE